MKSLIFQHTTEKNLIDFCPERLFRLGMVPAGCEPLESSFYFTESKIFFNTTIDNNSILLLFIHYLYNYNHSCNFLWQWRTQISFEIFVGKNSILFDSSLFQIANNVLGTTFIKFKVIYYGVLTSGRVLLDLQSRSVRCDIFGFFLLSFPQNERKIY